VRTLRSFPFLDRLPVLLLALLAAVSLLAAPVQAGQMTHSSSTLSAAQPEAVPPIVTAGINRQGNLQLTAWRQENGELVACGDAEGEATAGPIAVDAVFDSPLLVTAYADEQAELKLASWEVDPDCFIEQRDSMWVGPITEVDILGLLSDGRMVTAARGEQQELVVSTWRVDGQGAITWLDAQAADTATDLHLATLATAPNFFVTANQDAEGRLHLIVWSLDDFGELSRVGSFTGDEVRALALPESSGTIVTTPLITTDGNLQVDSWRVEDDDILAPLGDALAGPVAEGSPLAAAQIYQDTESLNSRVVTAVQDEESNLRLHVWDVEAEPAAAITEHESFTLGPALHFSLAASAGLDQLALARIDLDEMLQVMVYPVDEEGNLGEPVVSTELEISRADITFLQPAVE
jgi:hypothetical protein